MITPALGVGSLASTDVLLQNIYLRRQSRDLRLYLGNILVQTTRVSIQLLLKSIVLEIVKLISRYDRYLDLLHTIVMVVVQHRYLGLYLIIVVRLSTDMLYQLLDLRFQRSHAFFQLSGLNGLRQ